MYLIELLLYWPGEFPDHWFKLGNLRSSVCLVQALSVVFADKEAMSATVSIADARFTSAIDANGYEQTMALPYTCTHCGVKDEQDASRELPVWRCRLSSRPSV